PPSFTGRSDRLLETQGALTSGWWNGAVGGVDLEQRTLTEVDPHVRPALTPRTDRGLVVRRINSDPRGVPGQVGTGLQLRRRAGQYLVQRCLYPFRCRAQLGGDGLGVVVAVEAGIAYQAGELRRQRHPVEFTERAVHLVQQRVSGEV